MNLQQLSDERDALIMANARRLIKAHKQTSNSGLYMNLFGTGFGTAMKRCESVLGCDPSGNTTNYTDMVSFIRRKYHTDNSGI